MVRQLRGLVIAEGLLLCFSAFAAFLLVPAALSLREDLRSGVGFSRDHGFSSVLFGGQALAFSLLSALSVYWLRRGRLRGQVTGFLTGSWLTWLSLDWTYLARHTNDAYGDAGEIVLVTPFMLAGGLWLCVYLVLPHVRRGLAPRAAGDGEPQEHAR